VSIDDSESDPISALLARPRFGSGVCFHRLTALGGADLMTPWGRGLDAIRITGSSGKGSVAAVTAATLGALGLRIGLFTSPHLYSFHERFLIDGEPVDDAVLRPLAARVVAECAAYEQRWPGDRVGAFEAFTLLALRVFAALGVEAVVLEAGIGGRYDCVRWVPGMVDALVSVDLEHTNLLGGTLEAIALDKADLVAHGGTLAIGRLDPALCRTLAAFVALKGARARFLADTSTVGAVDFTDGTMTADLACAGRDFPLLRFALPGRYQIDNAALALMLVEGWLERHGSKAQRAGLAAAFRHAVGTVRWGGRLERVDGGGTEGALCDRAAARTRSGVTPEPPLFSSIQEGGQGEVGGGRRRGESGNDVPLIPAYIDVGHTPAAVRAAATAMRELAGGRPLVVVTGVSADKNAEGILAELVAVADQVVATAACHRSRPAEEIAALVARLRPTLPCRSAPTVSEAVAIARALAEGTAGVVYAAGGLFLAIEAATVLRGEDPAMLRFL